MAEEREIPEEANGYRIPSKGELLDWNRKPQILEVMWKERNFLLTFQEPKTYADRQKIWDQSTMWSRASIPMITLPDGTTIKPSLSANEATAYVCVAECSLEPKLTVEDCIILGHQDGGFMNQLAGAVLQFMNVADMVETHKRNLETNPLGGRS